MHVPTQVQALQAKVISRLLEPERLAWKVFQLYHLSQASQVQPLSYGASILFSNLNRPVAIASRAVSLRGGLQSSSSSPSSIRHCHAAIGCLKRTALLQQADFSACRQLSYHQQCLPSCTKIAHLRLLLQLQQPQLLARVAFSFVGTSSWRVVVSSAPAAPWLQDLSASGRQLIQDAQTGQLHTISPHLQFRQTPPEPVSNHSPVQVISGTPLGLGGAQRTSQLSKAVSPFTCKVSCGAWIIFTWGVGLGQSASPSADGQTSQGPTLTAHQIFCHQAPIGPSGLTCRPRLLLLPTSGQSIAETLQAMEVR